MVKLELLLCIIGILILLILVVKCNSDHPHILKKFKKLSYKIPEEELRFKISCLDENGNPTQPIITKDGWRCEHYYNTTDVINNPSVNDGYFYTRCLDNDSQEDFFQMCNKNPPSGCTGNYTPSSCDTGVNGTDSFGNPGYIYAAYGIPETGTTSGFRVDHPFNSNTPIFLRVDDTKTSPSYDNFNPSHIETASNIEDCEELCASANLSNTKYPYSIQGCYSYSYYGDGIQNNCSIHVPTSSNDINEGILTFLKS